MSIVFVNLVTPKAGAEHVLLFSKLASALVMKLKDIPEII
jgi:hypothetical protein